jgi:hypothetical protein
VCCGKTDGFSGARCTENPIASRSQIMGDANHDDAVIEAVYVGEAGAVCIKLHTCKTPTAYLLYFVDNADVNPKMHEDARASFSKTGIMMHSLWLT